MNVYCVKCGSEMEIMRDLGSELRVYPCGCGGKGKQKRQPTKRAVDLADESETEVDPVAQALRNLNDAIAPPNH